MKNTLRKSLFALATLAGFAALAQQPYTVYVSGTVAGCTANSTVNITTMGGTLPAMDIDVPVLPPSCTFSVVLNMASQGGAFIISTPCLGAIQTQVAQYQVPNFMDSTWVSVTFNCGNTMTDCLGTVGGSALPGTPCATPAGATGIWSADCDCIPDSTGGDFDCLGILNGPNQPGTACVTFFNEPGTWNADCICIADSSNTGVDCMGIPGGSNLPGSACQDPATGIWGVWTADCTCDADSTGGAYDCMGQLNGPNMPGTPCWLFGTNFIGVWDANCACVDSTNTGGFCAASFYAMQAYEIDSTNPNGVGTPIPYEIWVWNLSSGIDPMTCFWDFGDGSSSTSAYPTHAYSGNGPYNLCLTIADASGCTSTYCDSISIDQDGILNGLALDPEVNGNEARDNGFTINIQNPLTLGLTEAPAMADVRAWPNPATEELYLSVNARFEGAVTIAVIDVNGREVALENRSQNMGRNQHRLDLNGLAGGLYTARVTDRTSGESISLRFAKAR